jgi:hypothetical protein
MLLLVILLLMILAQGTGNAKLTYNVGNDNDQSVSGKCGYLIHQALLM